MGKLAPTGAPGPVEKLDSWKEIAAFFARDERTVKRWEKERGLPVHRLPGSSKARVFAYGEELAAWSRSAAPETEVAQAPAPLAAAADVGVPPTVPAPAGITRRFRVLAASLGAVALAVVAISLNYPLGNRRAAAHTTNPEAEDLYLKGRYHWNKRTPEDLTKALDFFTQAIVHDPGYAKAYAGLADTYNLLREFSQMPSNEAFSRSLAAAKRAVELDDGLAEAHNSLAFASFYGAWDFATADREFKRAIELNPNYATAYHWYANTLMSLGRFPEAIANITRAQRLDPASASILADKGEILFVAGQRDAGIALLKQVSAADPAFQSPHRYLQNIYLIGQDYPNYLARRESLGAISARHRRTGSGRSGRERLCCRGRRRHVRSPAAGPDVALRARSLAGLQRGPDLLLDGEQAGSAGVPARGGG